MRLVFMFLLLDELGAAPMPSFDLLLTSFALQAFGPACRREHDQPRQKRVDGSVQRPLGLIGPAPADCKSEVR